MKKKMTYLRKTSTMLLYSTFLILPCTLFSQNLDDFRTAASANGVNLIPFSDLRKDATPIADDVQRRKEETQAFNYDLFASQKNNMLKEIKKNNDDIFQFINKVRTYSLGLL